MSIKTIWASIIIGIVLTSLGIYAMISLEPRLFASILVILGLLCIFFSWFMAYWDMMTRKIEDRAFWVFLMLLVPAITPLFYFWRRKADS